MKMPKDKVLELLRSRGDQGKAEQSDRELPDNVDPEQHAGLLSNLDVNPSELLGKFASGKIPGR